MSDSTYWIISPESLPLLTHRPANFVITPGMDLLGKPLPKARKLIITSAGLERGTWATAHAAEGTALADELMRWIKRVRERGGQVWYLVAADFAPGVNNNVIMAAVDKVVVIEPDTEPVAEYYRITAPTRGAQ